MTSRNGTELGQVHWCMTSRAWRHLTHVASRVTSLTSVRSAPEPWACQILNFENRTIIKGDTVIFVKPCISNVSKGTLLETKSQIMNWWQVGHIANICSYSFFKGPFHLRLSGGGGRLETKQKKLCTWRAVGKGIFTRIFPSAPNQNLKWNSHLNRIDHCSQGALEIYHTINWAICLSVLILLHGCTPSSGSHIRDIDRY